MMITCLFLTLSLAVVLVIVKSCSKLTKKKDLQLQLEHIFSHVKIIDAKFIGLYLFLSSNILTGLINLNVQTIYTSDLNAFLILTSYMAFLLSTSYFFYFYKKQKK